MFKGMQIALIIVGQSVHVNRDNQNWTYHKLLKIN